MDHAPILHNHHTIMSGPRSDTSQSSHDDEWTTLRYFTIVTRWWVDHSPILHNHQTMTSGPRSDTSQSSHDDEWTTLRYFTIITRWWVDHAPILYNHHTMVSGEYRSMINRGSTVLLLNGLHCKYIVKQKLNKKLEQWFSNQYIFLAQDYSYIINDES
jgi:hypothetical protein